MDLNEQKTDIPLISGYGDGGFRVANRRFEGSILISARGVYPWKIKSIKTITKQSLSELFKGDIKPEFLLLGLGNEVKDGILLSRALEKKIKLPCEVMTTGAAVRTYNVLVLEGRRLAAAILAV